MGYGYTLRFLPHFPLPHPWARLRDPSLSVRRGGGRQVPSQRLALELRRADNHTPVGEMMKSLETMAPPWARQRPRWEGGAWTRGRRKPTTTVGKAVAAATSSAAKRPRPAGDCVGRSSKQYPSISCVKGIRRRQLHTWRRCAQWSIGATANVRDHEPSLWPWVGAHGRRPTAVFSRAWREARAGGSACPRRQAGSILRVLVQRLYRLPSYIFLLLPLLCSPSNGCCSPDARWNVQEGLALYLIYHWRSKCCWFDCWPLFLSQIGNPLLSLYCPCLLFLKVLNYDILTFWVLLVCMILHSSSVYVIIVPCYSVEPWERWTSLLLEKYMSHQQWLQKSTWEMQLAGHLPW